MQNIIGVTTQKFLKIIDKNTIGVTVQDFLKIIDNKMIHNYLTDRQYIDDTLNMLVQAHSIFKGKSHAAHKVMLVVFKKDAKHYWYYYPRPSTN